MSRIHWWASGTNLGGGNPNWIQLGVLGHVLQWPSQPNGYREGGSEPMTQNCNRSVITGHSQTGIDDTFVFIIDLLIFFFCLLYLGTTGRLSSKVFCLLDLGTKGPEHTWTWGAWVWGVVLCVRVSECIRKPNPKIMEVVNKGFSPMVQQFQ